jgi:hypothetical protein
MSLEALTRPFAEEEIKSFRGAGGRELTYVEDEQVMDRLDEAFGMGNWAVQVEPFPYVDGVVKVRLGVRPTEGSDWVWYEDFGYPNNKDGQALKESVSDGIRRCGRYLGIARDLYRKDAGPAQPRPPAAPRTLLQAVKDAPTPPTRSSTAVPEPPLDWDVLSDKKPEPFAAAQAARIEPDGSWTYGELKERADKLSVPLKVLGDTSKRLYGPNAWKLTDLTGEQRYAVAVEVGLL